jgi:hypothetical protein
MSSTIETERTAHEVELAHVLRRAPFPTSIAIASRAARIAENAGGSTIVCDRRLGTDYARPYLVDVDDSRHAHDDDPMIREYGDSIT